MNRDVMCLKRWMGVATLLAALTGLSACPDDPVSPTDTGGDIGADTDVTGDGVGDGGDVPVGDADAAVGDADGAGPDDGSTGDDGTVGDADATDADGGPNDADAGDVIPDVWPPVNPSCLVDTDCEAYLVASPFDDECLSYSCDVVSETCVFNESALDGAVCGADDPCIQQATCSAGFCDVTVPTCDDGDPCTQDDCDASGACSTTQLGDGDACDDDVACTENDVCDAVGSCAGTPTAECECQTADDCSDLPIDACNGSWICGADYTCTPDPSNAIICDTTGDSPCEATVCNPATAACETNNLSNGVVCDTGDACVPNAVCEDGACTGPPLVCDDGNPCTTDACDSQAGGCVFTNDDNLTCDDGDPCTTGDSCSDGSCVAPGTLDCDDGNDCTTDQCETGSGGCVYGDLTQIPCEDGDLCTVGDTCEDGSCSTGPSTIQCNDAEDCTDDTCNSTNGECEFTPNNDPCSDGSACTANDACQGGVCTGDQPDCDDGNPCTLDTCQDQDGSAVCINQPLTLDACDDGDPCTSADFCFDGTCVGGDPDPLCAGCQTDTDCDTFQPTNQCVGNFVCNQTTFQCEPEAGTEVTCAAMETACTENQCDPTDGQCKMLPKTEGTTCDDNDPCTESDICSDLGTCNGSPKPCSDGDDCTTDECDAGGNCVNNALSGSSTYYDETFDAGLPNGWTVSSDSSDVVWAATSDENAGGGAGQAMRATGPGLSYDFGEVEAQLSLPPTLLQGNSVRLRFQVKADFAEETGEFNKCFDDKDYLQVRVYTSPTAWQPVYCLSNDTGGQFVEVETNINPVSTDVTIVFVFHSNATINDAAGVVVDNIQVTSTATCSTGVGCIPGVCSAGSCQALPHECDDNDPCTSDDCNAQTGVCEYTPIPGCECAIDTDCGFSFNPCIDIQCNAGTCEEVELSGACDDGSDCSQNDACVAGECVGDAIDCSDGDPCTLDECDPFLAPGNVCFNTPATLPCDDGDLCTFNDTCDLAGGCAGTVIDCGDGSCLNATCNGSTGQCEFSGIKNEGSVLWLENFEDEVPGALPDGWEIEPGEFLWTVGFGTTQSAPFAMVIEGPNQAPAVNTAGTTTVELEPLTVPTDGAYLSYYLYLSRSPAYQASTDVANDVLRVSVDGQLADIQNTHNPSFVEVILDLPAATYGGSDVSIVFEWANGQDSVGEVVIDTMSLRALAPCDDGDACTTDDSCSVGVCGGDPIPGCTP